MLKKLMSGSTFSVNEIQKDEMLIEAGDSSPSEASEVVPEDEIPKPERRFFFRKPASSEQAATAASNSALFDPFRKMAPRKSKSCTFTVGTKNVQSTVTRSKSVHFADILATYYDPSKPSKGILKPAKTALPHSSRARDLPQEPSVISAIDQGEVAHDESPTRHYQSSPAGSGLDDTKTSDSSSESDSDGESVSVSDNSESESHTSFAQNTLKHNQKVPSSLTNERDSDPECSVEDSDSETPRELDEMNTPEIFSQSLKAISGLPRYQSTASRNAGKILQSVFRKSPKKSCIKSKVSTIESSESTEVEFEYNVANNTASFNRLCLIYHQLSAILGKTTDKISECDYASLYDAIESGLEESKDILSSSKSLAEAATSEMLTYKRKVKDLSKQHEVSFRSLAEVQQLTEEAENYKKILMDHRVKIQALQQQVEEGQQRQFEAAEELRIMRDKADENQAHFTECQTHMDKLKAYENRDLAWKIEKESMMNTFRIANARAHDLQVFQEQENEAHLKEITSLKNQLSQLQEDLSKASDSSAALEVVKLEISHQKNMCVKHCREIKNLQALNDKKDQKISDLVKEKLDLSKHFDLPSPTHSKQNCVLHEEYEKQTLRVSHLESELTETKSLLSTMRKHFADRATKDAERLFHIKDVKVSNSIAVDALLKMMKSTFDLILPGLHQDSVDVFTKLYSEVSSSHILTLKMHDTVMVLRTMLITVLREILASNKRNENLLAKEYETRSRFQESVLNSFERLVSRFTKPRRMSSEDVTKDSREISA